MRRDKKLILKMWSATAFIVCAIMVYTLVSVQGGETSGIPSGIGGGGTISNITVLDEEEDVVVIEEEPVALAASSEEASKPVIETAPGPIQLSAAPVVRELRITIRKADGSYMAKYSGCSNVEQDIFEGILDFKRDGKEFHFSGIVGIQATISGDVEYRYYLIA